MLMNFKKSKSAELLNAVFCQYVTVLAGLVCYCVFEHGLFSKRNTYLHMYFFSYNVVKNRLELFIFS